VAARVGRRCALSPLRGLGYTNSGFGYAARGLGPLGGRLFQRFAVRGEESRWGEVNVAASGVLEPFFG
jgi:hypothetical protein